MTSPWTRTDAGKAALLICLGAVVWFLGWWQVSDRPSMDRQIAPLNVAVVGLVVIGVGQASWFLAGRRAVGRRRRVLLEVAGPRAAAVATTPATGEILVGGQRLFHQADCVMARGRGWTPQARSAHEAAGRGPCGLCNP